MKALMGDLQRISEGGDGALSEAWNIVEVCR